MVEQAFFQFEEKDGEFHNAKEPDAIAEFCLFFKEVLCAHQALSPGSFGKVCVLFLVLCTSNYMLLFRCGSGGA